MTIEKPRRRSLCITLARGLWSALALACLTPAALAADAVVTKADCQKLVRYVPDGGAEYKPGVDAYGRPVVPADLNGGPVIKAPEVVTFNVQVNLRNFQRGPEADAQAHSAAVTAANKAANAAGLALIAASTAESAAAANPDNTALGEAAAATRSAATAATSAVTVGDKSAAASDAAAAAASASAALPGDDDLATAAQAVGTASQDASQANEALNQSFRAAARIGQYLGQPIVGNIVIKNDQVYFNNQPLIQPEEAELAAACRKLLKIEP